jgi:mono/diheme cytochrome c family protein
VDRLDFGNMENPKAVETFADWGSRLLPHRKPEWALLKLQNPRVFDAGVTKQPGEKLLMPNFHFTGEEADAVVTYLMSLQVGEISAKKRPVRGPEDVAAEKMHWLTRRYNCYGCHTVASEVLPAGEGGAWEPRPRGGDIRPWILDGEGNPDRDFWPPTLGGESVLRRQAKERAHLTGMKPEEIRNIREVGEGTKVQPAWLFRFLRDPGAMNLRYWLRVRMPTFPYSEAELNALIQGFAAEDRVPFPFEDRKYADIDDAERAKARDFFQTLECAKCHPVRGAGGPAPSGAAPDLTYARERLRPEWVRLWLQDPAALQPGTKMPPFWPWEPETLGPASATGPKNPKYDNDPHRQMRAVLDYVFDIGRPAAPSK